MVSMTTDEGNGQFRTEMNCSGTASDSTDESSSLIEEKSFTLGFQQRSSRKAVGTKVKALVGEEMTGEMKIRRQSQSVIARLMGLDPLPPPQVLPKQQKVVENCFQKTSSLGLRGSHKSDEHYSSKMSNREHQEFKDSFELMEPVWKGMLHSKQNEKDMEFLRQKFTEAKHLSTDVALQDSKELNDASEIVDSNKDIFLKFLQEPNSLFAKHLYDLRSFPISTQASHATVLKPLKGTKYESREICSSSERRAGKHAPTRSSFNRPTTSSSSYSLKELSGNNSHHPFRSRHTSKSGDCLLPTRIVILKPSLEKVQDKTKNAPLLGSPENLYLGFRKQRELRRIQELPKERRRHKLSYSVEAMRHKEKGSREIAREVTKQMRQSISCTTKELKIPRFAQTIRDEGSCQKVSNLSGFNEQTSGCIDDWNRNLYPLSSYSSESSMNREARKCLSDRWKTTHRLREVGRDDRGSNTLGEMLAISDTETLMLPFDSVIAPKFSDEKSFREELGGKHGYPSGISSRDGWKDECFIKLPRSASLSHGTFKSRRSSTDRRHDQYTLKDVLNFRPNESLLGNPNQRSSSRKSLRCNGEENKLPVPEICVSREETRSYIFDKNLSEMEPIVPEVHGVTGNADPLGENSLPPKSVGTKMSFTHSKEQVQQPTEDGEYSSNGHNDKVIKEISCDHLQEDPVPSQSEGAESVSSISSRGAEQPSPVSVLELLEEEENEQSNSKCFEMVGADLQELRMQLQLLKLESEYSYEEEETEALSTVEDEGRELPSILRIVESEKPFRDVEERDFSYLVDVLIDSGIHSVIQSQIFDACYSPEYPVDPSVFERLEKKYATITEWSRSERKLLFDQISSILAWILAPSMDLHPWVTSTRRPGPAWAREGLSGEVWRIVMRQRKELSRGNPEEKVLDPHWLELEDHIDMIGREIEKMLKEELMEELALEFLPRSFAGA